MAVILLVAITVILSSVMYLVVSNLTVRVDGANRLAAVASRSGDGTNWTIQIVFTQGTFPANNTYVVVRGLSGETLLARTALGAMSGFLDYTDFGFVSPGDTLHLSTTLYPPGAAFEFMDDTSVLFQGTLR